MAQTNSRLLDELARLMSDAAGAASGIRKEIDSVVRGQAEKVLRDLDVVSREEFDAVKAMAQKARAENDALAARVDALEGKKGPKVRATSTRSSSGKPAAKKTSAAKSKPGTSKRKTSGTGKT